MSLDVAQDSPSVPLPSPSVSPLPLPPFPSPSIHLPLYVPPSPSMSSLPLPFYVPQPPPLCPPPPPLSPSADIEYYMDRLVLSFVMVELTVPSNFTESHRFNYGSHLHHSLGAEGCVFELPHSSSPGYAPVPAVPIWATQSLLPQRPAVPSSRDG